jgi:predicted ATP-dependent protease
MDIAVESIAGYWQFIRKTSADATAGVLELTRGAVVEVLQYGARLSGSNEKLSTKFKPILDLLTEASYWAKQAGHAQVSGDDVATAIKKRWDFEGRMRRRMQEGYWKDVFHVQTEGAAVGQTNALTVYGGEFGLPTRATAVVEAGKNGVTGLDRSAGWSGPSYVKGLETLKSFLAHEFGQEKPLPFEVRISKEQLYGGIDGDSSTSTNIYTSRSALSKAPIKQSIAITGSADQFGNVQAIGGVNQKIEGFFDVLTAKLKAAGKTLDGSHGVIIPATNIPDLMLRADVVEAVKAGKFHVWGVTDVRQGIELLTGVAYPEIKRAIDERARAVRKGK